MSAFEGLRFERRHSAVTTGTMSATVPVELESAETSEVATSQRF